MTCDLAGMVAGEASRIGVAAARAEWRDWTAGRADRSGVTTAPAVDAALGALFLAAMIAERAAAASAIDGRMPLAVVLSTLIAGGLALRRRAPLTGYLLSSAALSAEALLVLPSPVAPYANLIGLYCVGAYATRRRAWCGAALVLPAVVAYFVGVGPSSLVEPAGVLLTWLLAWGLGYSTARRHDEQQVSRRLLRQQTVVEERARIARDLHDVIGHTVNVMLVQAGAARRVLAGDPAKTRELLASMEQTGRDALAELDLVLGVLRGDEPALREAPGEPGLAGMSVLAARLARAGMHVCVQIAPDAATVPRSVDLIAYRVVQEALTNALKHGHAGSAEVMIDRDHAALRIEVRDDGGGAPAGYASGRGLLGIQERVSLFGGRVEHGPDGPRGFRLLASVPLP